MPLPVELPADLVTGDGKPLDVATDFHLANALNTFTDYRAAIQAPMIWREYESTSGRSLSPPDTRFYPVWIGPVFFGMESYGSTVTRTLTIAPFYRANQGAPNTGYIRITLSGLPPVTASGGDGAVENDVDNRVISGAAGFSQAEWSTQSTTYQVGEEKTLSIAVKDIFWGVAWLFVEKADAGQIRGFSKFKVGARTVI